MSVTVLSNGLLLGYIINRQNGCTRDLMFLVMTREVHEVASLEIFLTAAAHQKSLGY